MRRINPVFPQLMPDVDPNYFSQLNTQAPMGTFEKGKFDQPATLSSCRLWAVVVRFKMSSYCQ